MCGIAGTLNLTGTTAGDGATLRRMLKLLEHRGPEVAGTVTSGPAALGHARLSIIDLAGGLQPIPNEDRTLWVIVNGEVFNYVELGEELRARGHRFQTASDSEVILHLYEECGPALLEQLNGQYAFALWDAPRGRLLLGRDRLGVRPLFYTVVDGTLLFASEIKALLADHRVPRRVDVQALDQLFTFWSMLPGRTMFEGIREVPAGHYLVVDAGARSLTVSRYWCFQYGPQGEAAVDADACAAELRGLLIDATRLRLRADVPVGAYLSGGLDSSAIAAIARRFTTNRLQTFSVAFADKTYDERGYQERMAASLGVDHHVVECTHRDIGEVFPEVIWHTETPVLRTAPAPMFLLSALVRRHGLKVVLTGEGADEFLAGYNIFKEALVRRFWSRQPESRLRPDLLRGIYDWVPGLQSSPQAFLEAFFRQGLLESNDPAYSHRLRWRNTTRLKRFFSPELRAALSDYDNQVELHQHLSPDLGSWDLLSRAQYLEVLTFLSPYLLSSQGDRVAMAHSVEGRFPFLDHRVVEFTTGIPARLRMRGLDEKWLLKRAVADLLPEEIRQRPKRPYRAPIGSAFTGPDAPGYVQELLAPAAVQAAGLFNPTAVSRLLAKCARGRWMGENDEMALVGILSAQLWYQQFIRSFDPTAISEYATVVDVAATQPADAPA
ncbi:MAG TPA: asparagine synthase (glutamine-hydrolyzing) [Thermomicrobiaceae bacterium]|nr:asparagine synthase (glutamine-hydrolyzing) [Thermomicrobiaceae bacterium]